MSDGLESPVNELYAELGSDCGTDVSVFSCSSGKGILCWKWNTLHRFPIFLEFYCFQ